MIRPKFVVEHESNGTFSACVKGVPSVDAAADTERAAPSGLRCALTAHVALWKRDCRLEPRGTAAHPLILPQTSHFKLGYCRAADRSSWSCGCRKRGYPPP